MCRVYAKKAALLGHIDLIIVDEAHTINHNDTGGYRELIDDLTAYQSKVQGHRFDRQPLQIGHGLITDDPANL